MNYIISCDGFLSFAMKRRERGMVLFIPKACAKCGNILVKNTEKVVILIYIY